MSHKTLVWKGVLTVATLWAAAFLMAVSCDNGDDKVSVDVSQDNFCSEIAEVMCENMFDCCTGLQIEAALGIEISTDRKGCREDMTLVCEKKHADILYALDKGTASINADMADQCLESILVADSCFLVTSAPAYVEKCKNSPIAGKRSPGQDCLYAVECSGDAYCGGDRVCRPYPLQGAKCIPGDVGEKVCATGLFCNAEQKCQPLRGVGQSCSAAELCNETLYCNYDLDTGEGQCSLKKDAGTLCKGDEQCSSNECTPGVCSNDGTKECYDDSACEGTCPDTGAACTGGNKCAGTCSTSDNFCDDDTPCTGTGETCNQDDCPAMCIGNPVCGDDYAIVDYCAIGLAAVDMF
ncbi:MAG: hypothetical protein PHU25_07465 [Deltaproteobacteria bacterium]|nr:hypothetical protein [Deltaproteobacteria bacterium]